MVLVQGGTLPAGSALAGQTVSAFHIARFETTWAEWRQVRTWAVANGYTDLANVGEGSADNHPVRNVSWYDAVKWLNAKSQMEGFMPVYSVNGTTYKTGQSIPTLLAAANGYRLPAEAEWEWAARGGVASQGYTYSGSNDINAVAWYSLNSGNATKAVGTKLPNEQGLYDMCGNISEWCWDENTISGRRMKGGGWLSNTDFCNVSYRHTSGIGTREIHFGFRIARNAISDMVAIQGGILPTWSKWFANQTVQDFQIGRTEITWDEWQVVRAWAVNNGYTDLTGIGNGTAGNHPVSNVNWYDVVKWCNAKSQMEGLAPVYTVKGTTYKTGVQTPEVNATANGYRLPSEKEWEWGALGGARNQGHTYYSGSDDVNAVAWYHRGNGIGGTKVAGTKASNQLGIYDMSGNVWEWCEDVAHVTYRRIRGGSWNYGAVGILSSSQYGDYSVPNIRANDLGLRLARSAGN
jgi:formylglycine-generating enzyme required for sulfatase activity